MSFSYDVCIWTYHDSKTNPWQPLLRPQVVPNRGPYPIWVTEPRLYSDNDILWIVSWSCLVCWCWSWSALFCVSSAYILLLDFVIFLQCLKNCAKFSLEKVITVSCDIDETGDFVGGGGFLPMAHFLDTNIDVRGWAHDDGGGGARELEDNQTK